MVELQCETCGKIFMRRAAEAKRNQKLGRRVYCSLECTGKANVGNLPPAPHDLEYLQKGKQTDEYSPFREYFKLIKRRTQQKNQELLITLDDIKQQWERQDGICPFTGWKLEIPRTSNWSESPITPRRASIDRIDSSVWYVPGNVQFVSVMANYCKNNFSVQDVIDFCRAVAEYQDSLTEQE
jgi:hypothetical protein